MHAEQHNTDEVIYVGFWSRTVASLIDTILLLMICAPLLTAYYGTSYWSNEAFAQGAVDVLLSWVFPIIAVIVFWIKKQATPGKQIISAKIVDARTGNKPTVGQCIVRYLAYYLSAIPLCLGFIWVAFDKRKQGWHDKLAGTVVIRYAKPIADKKTDES